MLGRARPPRLTYAGLGAIHHKDFLLIQRDEHPLYRSEWRRVKHPVSDLADFMVPPVVVE